MSLYWSMMKDCCRPEVGKRLVEFLQPAKRSCQLNTRDKHCLG